MAKRGEKMATIKDIAKYTGVSPTTVSNVIHGRDAKVSIETKEKVNKALKELNYTANMGGRLLANHGSRIIGVIIQDTEAVNEAFFDNPYHGELIQTLEAKIKEAGYFMMFHRVSDFEEGAKLADMWNLEGLIVSGTSANDINKWQTRVSVPIVFIDSYGQGINRPKLNVGIDDRAGALNMTKYLLRKGYSDIVFIAKSDSPSDWKGLDLERSLGVKEAMEEVNLLPKFVSIPTTYTNYGTFIKRFLLPIVRNETVFFCSSDLLAIQVISELYKEGITVPNDISVVSFDGTAYSKYATPQITSMRQDVFEKATAIMTLMVENIEKNNQKEQSKEIKTVLVEGGSVKNIRNK